MQALGTRRWAELLGRHRQIVRRALEETGGVRAARVAAVGHGGQVLVSEPTAELLSDEPGPGLSLRSLGEHRLKDLRPELISELRIAGVSGDFPPIRSLESGPNNLPIALTSFVGREREVIEVRRLLAKARLVTLTGPGGTGKTRLALQAAAELAHEFRDGVWFGSWTTSNRWSTRGRSCLMYCAAPRFGLS